jgi:hypothetical protein
MIMGTVENSTVRHLFDHLRRCISLHSDISMAPEARGYEAWPKLHYGDHVVWVLTGPRKFRRWSTYVLEISYVLTL